MADGHKIIHPDQMKVIPGDLPHPGAWIRRNVLEPFGLSVAEAARRINMNRPTLSNVLEGKHAVSRDLAYKLEALTGVSADMMIGLQNAYDVQNEREKRQRYRDQIERVPPVDA